MTGRVTKRRGQGRTEDKIIPETENLRLYQSSGYSPNKRLNFYTTTKGQGWFTARQTIRPTRPYRQYNVCPKDGRTLLVCPDPKDSGCRVTEVGSVFEKFSYFLVQKERRFIKTYGGSERHR